MTTWTYTFRAIQRRPGRTLLALGGIAVGVAILVANTAAIEAARRAYRQMYEDVAGKDCLEVVAPGQVGFDSAFASSIASSPLVRAVVPRIVATATVIDSSGATPALISAVDPESGSLNRDFVLCEGQPLSDGQGILLDAGFATAHGFRLGMPVRLWTPTGPAELRLTGTMRPTGAAAFTGAVAVRLTFATAQRLFDLPGKINSVQLILAESVTPERAEAILAPYLPEGLVIQPPSQQGELARATLVAAEQGLHALAWVAVVAGGFVVLNTCLMSLGERRRELAVLRALGATRRQVPPNLAPRIGLARRDWRSSRFGCRSGAGPPAGRCDASFSRHDDAGAADELPLGFPCLVGRSRCRPRARPFFDPRSQSNSTIAQPGHNSSFGEPGEYLAAVETRRGIVACRGTVGIRGRFGSIISRVESGAFRRPCPVADRLRFTLAATDRSPSGRARGARPANVRRGRPVGLLTVGSPTGPNRAHGRRPLSGYRSRPRLRPRDPAPRSAMSGNGIDRPSSLISWSGEPCRMPASFSRRRCPMTSANSSAPSRKSRQWTKSLLFPLGSTIGRCWYWREPLRPTVRCPSTCAVAMLPRCGGNSSKGKLCLAPYWRKTSGLAKAMKFPLLHRRGRYACMLPVRPRSMPRAATPSTLNGRRPNNICE